MQVVYLGIDLFDNCFKALLNNTNIKVMALYTYKTDNVFEFNCNVVKLAKAKNIPVFYSKITKEEIENYFNNGCEYIISAGYIYKIPVTKNFKGVNIHPALLPIGRGAWPYPCTILKGLKKSGVTLHKIAESFDTGDILLQSDYTVTSNETLDSLTEKSRTAAEKLLNKFIKNSNTFWQNGKKQTGGEYWREPTDKDRTIFNTDTVNTAQTKVRAFGSYGVIYGGKEYKNKTNKGTDICLKDGEITLYL